MKWILSLLLLSQIAPASYFFKAQKGVKQEAKNYDVTGKCEDIAKTFDEMMTIMKAQEENGNTSKEFNTCNIDSSSKKLSCDLTFMGSLYSNTTTYWFDTKDSCENARTKLLSSINSKSEKIKAYKAYWLDYNHEDGYGKVVGAGKSCFSIQATRTNIKEAIEKIAQKDGFFSNSKCEDGAFTSSYSCKKDEKFSRAYSFFENSSECSGKLKSIRSNYGLK